MLHAKLPFKRKRLGANRRQPPAERSPNMHAPATVITSGRDLRLDLFRGIALWLIFLDHIPHDVVGWLTLRNYGFSDAAEFFVFISGYLVGFIYVPIVKDGMFMAALKRLWTRAAQMYVAHIMLFLIFTAQIARTVRRFVANGSSSLRAPKDRAIHVPTDVLAACAAGAVDWLHAGLRRRACDLPASASRAVHH